VKEFLRFRSRRWTHDGWAIKVKGAQHPLKWSVCTTREEARQLHKESYPESDFFERTEVVKVRIFVEVVE
jgi:hypothetical protein